MKRGPRVIHEVESTSGRQEKRHKSTLKRVRRVETTQVQAPGREIQHGSSSRNVIDIPCVRRGRHTGELRKSSDGGNEQERAWCSSVNRRAVGAFKTQIIPNTAERTPWSLAANILQSLLSRHCSQGLNGLELDVSYQASFFDGMRPTL